MGVKLWLGLSGGNTFPHVQLKGLVNLIISIFSLLHNLAPTLVGDISDLGHFRLKQTVPVEYLRHPVKWLSSNARFLPIFSRQIDTSWA